MARVTKKMLTPLEKAELREIIVIGMELEPRKAYRLDAAASIKWIQERATDFAGVNLETLGTDCFRAGVVDYLTELQQYILGKKSAPKFPSDQDSSVSDVTEEPEVIETAKVVEEAPVKRKRGRPRKNPVVETKATEVEETPPKRRRGRPRKTETTAKTATKTPKKTFKVKEPKATATKSAKVETETLAKEEIQTTSTTEVAVNLSTDLETLASFQATVDSLRAEVQALRTEQTAAFNMLNNALVYILNTAIIEDDEDLIKDLTQLKM